MWAPPHPEPLRPSAGWYTLPVFLLVAIALWCASFVGLNLAALRAADGPAVSGDPEAGFEVRLDGGHGYFLYVGRNVPGPSLCALRWPNGMRGEVVFTRDNAWSADPPPGMRYTATFEAPRTGTALLTCQRTEGRILLAPDDTVYDQLRWTAVGGSVVGGAALAMAAVVWVRRFRARRAAREREPEPRPAP